MRRCASVAVSPRERPVSIASRGHAPAGWRTRLGDPMWVAVLALGITQITAWGTSYYCLGVLAGPISRDTGWSRGFVRFGFTGAVLAMAVASHGVGRLVGRRRARSGTGARRRP